MILDKHTRVLVTGATGFLGMHTIRMLTESGITPRVFVWDRETPTLLKESDTEIFTGDITRFDDCVAATRDIDVVFHVAAKVSFQPSERNVQEKINTGGTQNMVSASLQNRVKRFVHVSTVNALGYPDDGAVGDENTPFNWTPFNIGYMETKKAAQDAVLNAVPEGLDAVVCNPSTMFGPFDVNMNAASYVKGLSHVRGLMICPPGGTNIVDVRSVARGLLQAAVNGRKGNCYILGGLNLTYKELFSGILNLLGKRAGVVTVPAPVILAAARACETVCNAAKRIPPLTVDMAQGAIRKLFYSSEKAKRELGYRPGDPWKAVSDTIKWLEILP